MTPQELWADISTLRDSSYLYYGVHGPSPEYVVDATTAFLADHEYDGGCVDPSGVAFDAYETVRERIAAFVGAAPTEIDEVLDTHRAYR